MKDLKDYYELIFIGVVGAGFIIAWWLVQGYVSGFDSTIAFVLFCFWYNWYLEIRDYRRAKKAEEEKAAEEEQRRMGGK